MNYGPEFIRKGLYGYRLQVEDGDDIKAYCPVVWVSPNFRSVSMLIDKDGFVLELPMEGQDKELYKDLQDYYREHREEYIAHIKKLRVKDML